MCVPLTSDVCEIAACPPSPIADNPSPLPSPPPSLRQAVALLPVLSMPVPGHCMPGVVLYYRAFQDTIL